MKKHVYGLSALFVIVIFLLFAFSYSKKNESVSTLSESSDALATVENTQKTAEEKTAKVAFLENWTSGTITGVTGENNYTEILKTGNTHGTVETFLTFEVNSLNTEYRVAFVAAGKQEANAFYGSIWFVSENGEHSIIEQNVCITDTEIQYQEVKEKCYIFLNYQKEDRTCGRVFFINGTSYEEILTALSGKKTVDDNGHIICMYPADDSIFIVETDVSTGKKHYKWEGKTEKPYTLCWYEDGTIREVKAEVATEEELGTSLYGKELIKQVEELYPNGMKQYIIRENGEVNVNIAIEEKEKGSFYYMTFHAEKKDTDTQEDITVLSENEEEKQENNTKLLKNPVVLVDSGTGSYLLHMTGEASWKEFLNSFAGENHLLPNDSSVLPWYLQKKFVYDGVEISLEKESLCAESKVVGIEFIPEGDLLNRLTNLVPDNRKNGYVRPYWITEGDSYYEDIETEFDREKNRWVELVGKTDSFLLYGTAKSQILEIQGGIYLWIPLPYQYYFEHPFGQPQMVEMDFDNDGENELLILGQIDLYGSGYYVESLLIADKGNDGNWFVYELQDNWYKEELHKHYQTEYIDGKMNLRLDGELVGGTEDTHGDESYYYTVDRNIEFKINNGSIYLYSELTTYSDHGSADGTLYSGNDAGNGIRMKIDYLGEGKWSVQECSYIAIFLECQLPIP